MAEMTNDPGMGGVGFEAGAIMRAAGAVVSLGLLVGMGVWSYKLVVRDATGVPVVRAMEGPMRDTPSNPGGELALNTGLAVNEVAAEGGASDPEDVLLLAPQSSGLTEEDLLTQPTAEAEESPLGDALAPSLTVETVVEDPVVTAVTLGTEPTAEVDASVPDAPMTADQVLALADQLAAGVAPLSELAEGETIAPALSVDGAAVADGVQSSVAVISASIPGVTSTARPIKRPASLRASAPAPAAAAETVPAAPEVSASAIDAVVAEAVTVEPEVAVSAPIAVGTTLVQLGAFDSADVAQSEWVELNRRFADFMSGKDLVIQEATSGGQTFYRLRATGFADLSDARRFCSALVAEQAACIPVVVQ